MFPLPGLKCRTLTHAAGRDGAKGAATQQALSSCSCCCDAVVAVWENRRVERSPSFLSLILSRSNTSVLVSSYD
jgi:hypothetical protein